MAQQGSKSQLIAGKRSDNILISRCFKNGQEFDPILFAAQRHASSEKNLVSNVLR